MLPTCVYCFNKDDLVKCKRVGCSNLLYPDHFKNYGGHCSRCLGSEGLLLRRRMVG